jgi:dTDP-4-amino-4,6-dideoxygalactose transaminase
MIRIDAINDLRRHASTQGDALKEAIARVVNSGWYMLGRELEAFESEFAAYCGTAYCVGVANGTDALELALRASDIGQGARVLTVANAGAYSAVAIRAAGAEPVFVDVDAETLLVDDSEVMRHLTSDRPPAAVIVTHLYGRLVHNIEGIAHASRQAGVTVIEDCAQAHGARLAGRRAGTFGDFGCFSFYPTKNLGALGDGGAVITADSSRNTTLRMLRQYGWASKYHIELAGGRNSRLDELQAAVLRAKLPRLDGWNQRRREIARQLSEGIRHPCVRCPDQFDEAYVAHLYVVRTPDRQGLQSHLRERGIACDVHYPLLDYQQPGLRESIPPCRNPNAEKACGEVLTLPCFPEMVDDEVAAVVDAVNAW